MSGKLMGRGETQGCGKFLGGIGRLTGIEEVQKAYLRSEELPGLVQGIIEAYWLLGRLGRCGGN